ncbi:MAG: sigma-54-dependent Fis family transcriptional regulator [Ignavibacteriales bacterium]|nr:sigma-54-dependent Fis family transcriptional regulator [Ignavibacteriales bacterium]
MKEKILVVDDDRDMCQLLSDILTTEGYEVFTAECGKIVLKETEKIRPEIILLDIRLPDKNGLEVLKEIKKSDENIIVIMLTASEEVHNAVNAMKLGAFDYFTKPFNNEEIILDVKKALQNRRLKIEVEELRKKLEKSGNHELFIGESPQVKQMLNQIKTIAHTNVTISIQGESGTGKELVARLIHQNSVRSGAQFVAVDCGTLPENLVESELFGYEKGAFTGAAAKKEGKFETANKGTIFLDEITNLPLSLQPKLLRIIQERKIQRLGSTKEISVDIRIVTATNKVLSEEVKKGKFREDLYHRINEFNIILPPLRERKEDIPLLANFFVEESNREFRKNIEGLSGEAMKSLLNYSLPGNVRELRNIIRKAVLLSDSDYIKEIVLDGGFISGAERFDYLSELGKGIPLREITHKAIKEIEKNVIKKVLTQTKNNKVMAAKILKIDRMTLYSKIRSLGL